MLHESAARAMQVQWMFDDSVSPHANDNNIIALAPFSLHADTKTVRVLPEFFEEAEMGGLDLSDKGWSFVLVDDLLPMSETDREAWGEATKDVFYRIYRFYLARFDHGSDASRGLTPFMAPFASIGIPTARKSALADLTTLNILRGTDGLASRLEEFFREDPLLAAELDAARRSIHAGKDDALFVKTGSTSGKNKSPLRAVRSNEEILHRITETAAFMRSWQSDQPVRLCAMKWDYALDPEREFRVFVVNRRVVAASQQLWFRKIEGMGCAATRDALAARFGAALLAGFTPELLAALPFPDCVLDVWVDDGFKLHVIETNSGGGWAASGASLFSWKEDADVIHYGRNAVPVLRLRG